jgi:hypothetical protein
MRPDRALPFASTAAEVEAATVAVIAGGTNSASSCPAPAMSTYIDCAPTADTSLSALSRSSMTSLPRRTFTCAPTGAGLTVHFHARRTTEPHSGLH